jgi:hypothetical protein
MSATMFLVENQGPIIALDQAEQLVGKLTPPTLLPESLILQEIRGSQALVSLIYTSSNFPVLANWNRGNMIIWIVRDNTAYVPAPPYQVAGHAVMSCDANILPLQNCTTIERTVGTASQTIIKNIMVSGHPGHGWDPQGAYGIGTVTWWANGLHYTIDADLPLSTLLEIAQSMNT